MSQGILNGTGDRFQLNDSADGTKQFFIGVGNISANSQLELEVPTLGGSATIVAASTEGNAGDILTSGGGSGSVNTWQAPTALGPQRVALVNRVGLGGAVGATTIYAVPSSGAGLYRISWVATITTAASSSSVLGGSNGFQVVWTNTSDSVVKTSNPTTTTAMTTAANTTGSTVSGVELARCKASTNLQYQFDYTSVGGTAMVYDLYVYVEFLG